MRMKWMRNLLFSLVTFLIGQIFALANVQAQVQDLGQIIAQPERPTVEQIVEWSKGGLEIPFPDRSLFAAYLTSQKYDPNAPANQLLFKYQSWFDLIIREAPKMIATFESAFPGAKFAFIGRDSALWADVFEMFYLSIGQKDRVTRIPVSKLSFRDTNEQMILGLLKSNGYAEGSSQPFIFVDSVSTTGRQGRRMLEAIYADAHAKGTPVDQLIFRVNMIGLLNGVWLQDHNSARQAGVEIPINSVQDAQRILAEEAEEFRKNPLRVDYRILDFHDGRAPGTGIFGANEAGYEQTTGVWNESNGKIAYDSLSETYFTSRGSRSGDHMAMGILAMQLRLWKQLSTVEFFRSVQKEASKIGYEFPKTRPEYIAIPRDVLTEALKATRNSGEFFQVLEDFYRTVNFGRIRDEQVIEIVNELSASKKFASELFSEKHISVYADRAESSRAHKLAIDIMFANQVSVDGVLKLVESNGAVQLSKFFMNMVREKILEMPFKAADINRLNKIWSAEKENTLVLAIRKMNTKAQLEGLEIPGKWGFGTPRAIKNAIDALGSREKDAGRMMGKGERCAGAAN